MTKTPPTPFLFALMFFALNIFFSVSNEAAAEVSPLSPEGLSKLREDWLFQVNGKPTEEAIAKELVYTKQLIERISNMENAPDLGGESASLAELAKKTSGDVRERYLSVRQLKHAVFFKNPLISFDRILLIDNPYPKGKRGDATDEWAHEARHRNGFMGEPGGRLLSVGLYPGSEEKNLLPQFEGSFWRPDLSFDGKEIVFCYQPVGEKSFHLYKCNADGSDVKQLTFGDYDDLDPIFTPDGKISFCSSRQHSYVRCMPMTHSFALSRCDADGKNIYVISANGEPDYLPSVMNDGRVLFTRWEYTDKALWRVQSLWTCNPDGTNPQIFWGNQSVWPDVLTEARSIPGSNKIIFTGVGHHAWFNGSIGIIDPNGGLDYPHGLTRVTQDIAWPEVGNGPADPTPVVDYHSSGKFYAYKTPYPLSEEYFLVSAREGGHLRGGLHNGWYFRLYLMDVYGNRELIYRGRYNAYHAMPLAPRTMPPIKPDLVEWPKIGSGEQPKPGVLYSNNVFEGAPAILKEKGKAIRVVQMDPKTYSSWHKLVRHDGPAVSVTQAEGVKRILGTVPIEEDGSVAFEVPAGEAIFFEMLDAEGRAIHVMRSFTNVMPGEVRGCFGCHESTLATRGNQGVAGGQMGRAIVKGPKQLVPPPWGKEESIGYARFVQPVLDKYCADCHQNPEHEAYAKLNMTFRPSSHLWRGWVYSQTDISPFTEPYLSMVSGVTVWGTAKPKDERNVPANIAGVFVVEAYDSRDPANLQTLPPYSAYSPVSKLVRNAMSGEHNGVKVTGEDLQRLIAWVDCNGPYLGDEEIRGMYDPISKTIETIPPIRPRIATAPRINRFDVRQDGDTSKIVGELKLMPDRVPGFRPNHAVLLTQHQATLKDKNTVKVEVVAANYGIDDEQRRIDVLDRIKKLGDKSDIIFLEKYNGVFGDPAPNTVKTLTITYKTEGDETKEVRFKENENLFLVMENGHLLMARPQ